eukprot:scaffold72753_cov35-Tisochrysis_lutea.AAC.3
MRVRSVRGAATCAEALDGEPTLVGTKAEKRADLLERIDKDQRGYALACMALVEPHRVNLWPLSNRTESTKISSETTRLQARHLNINWFTIAKRAGTSAYDESISVH